MQISGDFTEATGQSGTELFKAMARPWGDRGRGATPTCLLGHRIDLHKAMRFFVKTLLQIYSIIS